MADQNTMILIKHMDAEILPKYTLDLSIIFFSTCFLFRPLTDLVDGLHLQQGFSVCLHTTPFGATCPSVFLNSISKGIISNVSGSRHQLIMTDARCIPGSEGGGMYVTQAEDKPEER